MLPPISPVPHARMLPHGLMFLQQYNPGMFNSVITGAQHKASSLSSSRINANHCQHCFPFLAFTEGCCMQAFAQHQQLAFEGYCHLPELQPKEWYWIEGSDQRGPYSVAELFDMAYG